METEDYDKDCPECGREYEAHRADQIYCSKKCQWDFHNRSAREKRKRVCPIDNILHKNRNILMQLINKNDGIALRQELDYREFNFKFHTHSVNVTENETRVRCDFVYEYGIVPIEKEGKKYKIIKYEHKL